MSEMTNATPYRTLFTGRLVQESFLSLGGTDDPLTTVDSPFCRDGRGWPTLRGSGIAGALVATLRRALNDPDGKKGKLPAYVSDSDQGRQPSVWRFFNSHPQQVVDRHADKIIDAGNVYSYDYRQHVAIHPQTGAAEDQMLFNVETLPPETAWPFLLEVVTTVHADAAELAEDALSHWMAGRCLIGREVARGMGWMRLENLERYDLTTAHADRWPNARQAENYADYISKTFRDCKKTIMPAKAPLPGWQEYTFTLRAGERDDGEFAGYGIDSLSIGGHASEEMVAAWDESSFLTPDGMDAAKVKTAFDPDFAVVTLEKDGKRIPYIPGSSLRGPLRHALARLLKAAGKPDHTLIRLFGKTEQSARLLIRDAYLATDQQCKLQYAWLQQHAEDEFAGGAYRSSKFDRVAVMQGRFCGRLVIEDAENEDIEGFEALKALAEQGQIGIGGGQWRGHGWLRWKFQKTNGEDGAQSHPWKIHRPEE